jgi:hypothetical protein
MIVLLVARRTATPRHCLWSGPIFVLFRGSRRLGRGRVCTRCGTIGVVGTISVALTALCGHP